MKDIWQLLGAGLANVIVFCVAALIARLSGLWKGKPKPCPPIGSVNARTREQKDLLSRLRSKLGAKRCHLTKLHNGDHYIDGSEILRGSRVVEVTEPGVSFESERFKNLLLSTLLEEQDFVAAKGPGWYVTAALPESTFRYLNEVTGTQAGARAAVKKNGEIVGFVGADFFTAEKPANLDVILEYARWLEKTL